MTAANEGFGSIGHLALRFFGSLRPGGPPAADDAWAMARLLPGEQALWVRMSGPDRRHAVGVARAAIADLGPGGGGSSIDRPIVAAALLHDVGKVRSGLGTWARAGVTVVAMVAGRERVASWAPASDDALADGADGAVGRRAAAGAYVTHDRIGAALLRQAGSDPLTSTWAGEHHQPDSSWTLDRRIADALKTADGD